MRKRFKRIGAILQKETIQLLRDWRTLVMVLLLPVLEMFLFAYAVSLSVDHIPTIVADLSKDAESRAFIEALTASGYFDVEGYVEDEAEIVQTIAAGRSKAGLLIPLDFAARIEQGDAQVLILFDGADSTSARSGYSAASAVAQARGMELTLKKVMQTGQAGLLSKPKSTSTLPIYTSTRVLYNPARDDMIFLVPGLTAILLQVMIISQAATAVVREQELGVVEQILITPARPLELLIGKMLPNLALTVVDMVIIVLFGVFWFDVPFKGSPWLFAWLSLLFITSGLGLGLLISTVTKTQKEAQQITLLFMMLCILLTGVIYPREPMPTVVRAAGSLIPATYFVRIARGIITRGVGISFMWRDVLVLVIYSIVAISFSVRAFRKRLD